MAHCPFCGANIPIVDADSSDEYLRHLREHEANGDVEMRLKGETNGNV